MPLKSDEFKPEIEVVERFRGLMLQCIAGVDVIREFDEALDEIKNLDAPPVEKALVRIAVARMFYNEAVSRAMQGDTTFSTIWLEAAYYLDDGIRHLQDVCGKRVDIPKEVIH